MLAWDHRMLSAGLCGLVVCACGVRTPLEVTGAGGSGGSGAVVSSGSGTGASGGGGTNFCNSLEQQPVRSFDDGLGYLAQLPQLMASGLDGQRVSLLVRAGQEPPPLDGHTILTQITFFPWGQWTGDPLGVSVPLAAANAFALPKRPIEGLSFYAAFTTQATGPGMLYAVDAATTEAYPFTKTVAPEAYRQTYMTADIQGGYGFGHAAPAPGPVQRGYIGIAYSLTHNLVEVACTADKMQLDGIRVEDGYLAAITQGDFCGPAESIVAFHYDTDMNVQAAPIVSLSGSLLQMKLLPRDGGAWLLWQNDDAETAGPLLALPLASDGSVAGEQVQLIDSGLLFGRMSVTSFGNGLAVAYTDAFDPGPPNVIINLFDGSGARIAETSFTPVAWPRVDQPYALMGSPNADALLLAWSSADIEPDVPGNAQTYITRFDCSASSP